MSTTQLARVLRCSTYRALSPARLPHGTGTSLLFSRSKPYSTLDNDLRNHASVGPFNWKAGVLFVATGGGLWWYFTSEKEKMRKRKEQELATASYGKAKIGGPFTLVDHNGQQFTQDSLLGHWSLIYFGFTNCPDICPDELDKMGLVVDAIDEAHGPIVQPVFISCDPARDTVEQVKRYVGDFHSRMVGLTGTYDAIKAACKVYRVYFSTPPDATANDDYLVDHSIFFYLMNPRGEFVDAFGKSHTPEQVQHKVDTAIKEWKAAGNRP